eukprot:958156_1
MLITFYEFPSGNRLPIYGFSPQGLVSHGISHTSSHKNSMLSSAVKQRDAIIVNRPIDLAIGKPIDFGYQWRCTVCDMNTSNIWLFWSYTYLQTECIGILSMPVIP